MARVLVPLLNIPENCILIDARPERFELPTLWFEARCSDPLSYGRVGELSMLRRVFANGRKGHCTTIGRLCLSYVFWHGP